MCLVKGNLCFEWTCKDLYTCLHIYESMLCILPKYLKKTIFSWYITAPPVHLFHRDAFPGGYVLHRLTAFWDDANIGCDGPRCDWMIPCHHDNLRITGQLSNEAGHLQSKSTAFTTNKWSSALVYLFITFIPTSFKQLNDI